MMSNIHGKESK